MYKAILAPVSAVHICGNKSIVETRKFSKWTLEKYLNLREFTKLFQPPLTKGFLLNIVNLRKKNPPMNTWLTGEPKRHCYAINNKSSSRSVQFPLDKFRMPPPPTTVRDLGIVKNNYALAAEKRAINRLRSRLLRHLNSICLDKGIEEQIQILKVINGSDCLGKWHRTKISGLLSVENSQTSEARLRLLISELIAELSENLGGAA